ncbi:hypothetical protein FACS1894190_16420 [Spirochaetia bacterium]|nr:hypothetical protein FACS1894190_16420 [Spirochaetia bacterium]
MVYYDDMSHELLSPTQDIVFKSIFGDRKNADILANLLSTILPLTEEECSSLSFVDTHQNPLTEDGKLAILDVKVVTKEGKTIDIEIQVYQVKAMRARILYYGAGMITEQLKSSDRYSEIKPVVCIVISAFDMIPEETDFHNKYNIANEKSHNIFSPLFEIHTIELPKIPKDGLLGKDVALGYWVSFLGAKTKEELDMLAQHNPMIKKAVGVLVHLSADEQFRMQAAARDKAMRDYNTLMGEARAEGIEEGIEKGAQIKQDEFMNLLDSGKSIEEIKNFYKNH